MRLKKSAFALLLGGSLSVLNIGCAAVDALVSSPAGYSAGSGSTQRVAAIGRVFENQGRYAQARTMYRQALRSDPNNVTARDRLEYLASAHPANHRKSAMSAAIAVADSVAPPQKHEVSKSRQQQLRPSSTVQDHPSEAAIQMVRAFDAGGQVESASLTVGGELEEVQRDLEIVSVEVQAGNHHSDTLTQDAADSAGLASFSVDTPDEQHWADSVLDDINVVSRQDAFTESEVSQFEQVDPQQNALTEFDSTELFPQDDQTGQVGFWRPSRARVSLAEVLQWSDAPDQNSTQLITAISRGEDEGVQALSVALLGEIRYPEADTITALKRAAITGSPLVKAAALDALVLQGEGDSESLDGLLGLLAGDEAKIRTQAAGTLLRMADTEWCDDAINGLYRLLNDSNDEVVAVAATSLSEFGVAAIPCRDRLTEIAATTSSELVLEATSMALSRIPRSDQ